MMNTNTETVNNNHKFYDGYEGEGEMILKYLNHPNQQLHIWDGYFENIICTPVRIDNHWNGFTRDYHEGVRTFSGNEVTIENTQEYLSDLNLYKEKVFTFPETAECLALLIDFFTYAAINHESIVAVFE